MACPFWRPVDFEDDSDQEEVSEEPAKKKQRRCKVTAAEVEIVLQAYQIFGASGWEEVLDNIKEQVSGRMAGNWLQNEKIKEYCLQTNSKKSALKRIQRIVSHNVHKSHHQTTETNKSQRMSTTIKENKTRYSRKCDPEERRVNKFAHAANLNKNSSTDSSDEGPPEVASVINPGPSATNEENRTDQSARKLKKKRSDSRGKLAKQASKMHVEMCGKAMKMMDKINCLLENYSDSTD